MAITSTAWRGEAGADILIVDDDEVLRREIAAYLSDNGFRVQTAAGAAEMDAALARQSYDLVLLDVMMPGEGGLSICRRLAAANGPRIIIVSALGEEIDRVLGLELGADDYLAKPCSPRELSARVRAVLRRRDGDRPCARPESAGFEFFGYVFDPVKRTLRAPSGVMVLLTGGERSLLTVFLEHSGQVLARAELVRRAFGAEADVSDRTVDVQISRLRRKLNECDSQNLIRTLRGAGYMFNAAVQGR